MPLIRADELLRGASVVGRSRAIVATRPVAVLDIAASWRPDAVDRAQTAAVLQAVAVAAGLPLSR